MFGSYRVDKQTPLKTSTALRYVTTLGKNLDVEGSQRAVSQREVDVAGVTLSADELTVTTTSLVVVAAVVVVVAVLGVFILMTDRLAAVDVLAGRAVDVTVG